MKTASEAPHSRPRRALLGALSGVFIHPALGLSRDPKPADRGSAADHLRGLFRESESAVEIGSACLAEHGEALEDVARACAYLVGGRSLRPGDVKALIAGRIREDFALGRTVTVSGWVLSQTEAALCALAATSPRI